jgi:hypothetical protein
LALSAGQPARISDVVFSLTSSKAPQRVEAGSIPAWQKTGRSGKRRRAEDSRCELADALKDYANLRTEYNDLVRL